MLLYTLFVVYIAATLTLWSAPWPMYPGTFSALLEPVLFGHVYVSFGCLIIAWVAFVTVAH